MTFDQFNDRFFHLTNEEILAEAREEGKKLLASAEAAMGSLRADRLKGMLTLVLEEVATGATPDLLKEVSALNALLKDHPNRESRTSRSHARELLTNWRVGRMKQEGL